MKLYEYGKWTKILIRNSSSKLIHIKGHLPASEIRKRYPDAIRYTYNTHFKSVTHKLIPIT